MLRYLLDTNIAIHVIKHRPRSLARRMNQHSQQLALSAISLAELMHGAAKSQDPGRMTVVIEDFCSRLVVLPYGEKSASHYGSIRAELERRGETIGVNDLHIAAHARSEGLIVVTNNLREFQRVPALMVEDWLQP